MESGARTPPLQISGYATVLNGGLVTPLFLFQILIPSQATISTSIHILIAIHLVHPVATQVTGTQYRNTC